MYTTQGEYKIIEHASFDFSGFSQAMGNLGDRVKAAQDAAAAKEAVDKAAADKVAAEIDDAIKTNTLSNLPSVKVTYLNDTYTGGVIENLINILSKYKLTRRMKLLPSNKEIEFSFSFDISTIMDKSISLKYINMISLLVTNITVKINTTDMEYMSSNVSNMHILFEYTKNKEIITINNIYMALNFNLEQKNPHGTLYNFLIAQSTEYNNFLLEQPTSIFTSKGRPMPTKATPKATPKATILHQKLRQRLQI